MVNYQQSEDKLRISYFDINGKISTDRIPLAESMMFNWAEDSKFGRWDSFNGKKLIKRPAGKKGRLSKFRIMEILQQYYKIESGDFKKWHTMIPNIQKHFLDIETEILTTAIPSESNPQEKIRTIASHHKDHCLIYGSKELTPYQIEQVENKINVHFKDVLKDRKITFAHRYIENERYMISDYYKDMRENASLITGWNVLKFDWSYLGARYKHLGGRSEEVSPSRSLFSFYIADKWKKTEGQTVYIPYHLPVVDYMGLYEKLDTSISPKESSTLDWVSFEALKVRKVKYNGSLNALYESNYVDYCFYNAVDAILVQLLDQKLRTFDTLQSLAIAGRVQLHEGYFFSDILENLFVCEYLNRGKHFPDKKYLNEHIKFKGGFVLEPDRGLDEWVAGWDIEATYPSTISAMNFGMDTYKGTVAFVGEYEESRELLKDKNGKYLIGDNMIDLSLKLSKARTGMHNAPDTATEMGQLVKADYKKLYDQYYNEIMITGRPWTHDPHSETFSVTGAIFDKFIVSVPKAVLRDNIIQRLYHKKAVSDIAYDINQLEALKNEIMKKSV